MVSILYVEQGQMKVNLSYYTKGPRQYMQYGLKGKVEFWSCNCSVKETVWKPLKEKKDLEADKYWCIL